MAHISVTLTHVIKHFLQSDITDCSNVFTFRALMEAGCDPSVTNKKSQTPYNVAANKETRNVFRRFLADFPDRYDYSKV